MHSISVFQVISWKTHDGPCKEILFFKRFVICINIWSIDQKKIEMLCHLVRRYSSLQEENEQVSSEVLCSGVTEGGDKAPLKRSQLPSLFTQTSFTVTQNCSGVVKMKCN